MQNSQLQDTTNNPCDKKLKLNLGEEAILCDHVKKVKIAVAMAIIRNTPEDTSAYEYTKYLCGRYQKAQLNWRNHSEKLEEELLLIKQQLLLRNLSTAYVENGLDLENAQFVDTCDSELNRMSAVLPTPSQSSECSSGKCSFDENSGQDDFHKNKPSSFVSNVMTLRAMAKSGYSGHAEWGRSVVETTLQSVENTIKLFESDQHLDVSSTLLQTCIDSFVDLVDSETLPYQGQVKLLHLGATFLHVLGSKIVLNEELNCGSTQLKLCQCIMTLAQSDQLKHGIIRYLVQTILSFTDELRTRVMKEDRYSFKPHTQENMFHIFRCLEQILEKELTSRSPVVLVPTELAIQLQNYLDDAVLHLSEIYPMFVQYIWHISDLIQKVEKVS